MFSRSRLRCTYINFGDHLATSLDHLGDGHLEVPAPLAQGLQMLLQQGPIVGLVAQRDDADQYFTAADRITSLAEEGV